MIDSYKHKGLRKKLIEELEGKGISNRQVLNAIGKIPRHIFLDNAFVEFAYQDKAFPIGEEQTISQPYTVAFQSSLLEVKKGEKVLEIGTGSGYQTMVLSELGAKVYSIERQKALHIKTKALFSQLSVKARLILGDGYKGLTAYAPFDKILVTCGAPAIPKELLNQLKNGGKMVIPVGDSDEQVMIELNKQESGEIQFTEHGEFSFVPMLKKIRKSM